MVDLHGLNITPLQQILFDGTTDFAERFGFIVLAPMGFNLSSWWGSRPGTPVTSAAAKPGGDVRYSTGELAEIDAMALLKSIREQYTVDSDRILQPGVEADHRPPTKVAIRSHPQSRRLLPKLYLAATMLALRWHAPIVPGPERMIGVPAVAARSPRG